MSNPDGTSNPDGILSEPDRVIDVDGDSIVPGPGDPGPDEPVPGAPEGVPVDPDLTPDEPAPFSPDEGVGSGGAREVRNPAL